MAIKFALFDIDGCLTDGGYYASSKPLVLSSLEAGHEVYKVEDSFYFRRFNTKDFLGIQLLHDAGIRTAIITTSVYPCESQFKRACPSTEVFAGVNDKYEFVRSTFVEPISEGNLQTCRLIYTWDELTFMGDEINDARLLESVGLAACPFDAVPEIKKIVERHENGWILSKKGGDGCVREFTDMIRKIENIPATWCNWKEKTNG